MSAPAPLDLVEDLSLAAPEAPGHGVLFWLGVAAGALVLGAALLPLLRRAHRKLTAPVPPEKTALAALDALAAELDALDAREFALRASLILRVYIEARFGLRAPRRSTEEFLLQAAASPALTDGQRARVGDTLALCDRSKFALAGLAAGTRRELHRVVGDFVRATTPAAP